MRFCGLKLQDGLRFVSARKLSFDIISSRHNVPLGRSLFPIKKGSTTRSSALTCDSVRSQFTMLSWRKSRQITRHFVNLVSRAFSSTIFKVAARRESYCYPPSWKWRRLSHPRHITLQCKWEKLIVKRAIIGPSSSERKNVLHSFPRIPNLACGLR